MIATLATKQKLLKKTLVHTVGGFLRAHPHTNSERELASARDGEAPPERTDDGVGSVEVFVEQDRVLERSGDLWKLQKERKVLEES
jgi:hypothetical protein